jgi:hypothetical protein
LDRGFLGDDAALGVDARGLEVLGAEVDALDHHAVSSRSGIDAHDLADWPLLEPD